MWGVASWEKHLKTRGINRLTNQGRNTESLDTMGYHDNYRTGADVGLKLKLKDEK